MERPVHLVPPLEPKPVDWPSIAAASNELRRPRHLRPVRTEPEERRGDEEELQARGA